MVQYHGWISIHQSTDRENEDSLDEIVVAIKKEIDKMNAPNRLLVLRPINGIYVLHMAGITNHWSQDVDEAIELAKFISENAKGSYGLLYLHNDEDTSGLDNEFVVYKLARGTFEKLQDQSLSPVVPTISD